MLGLLTHLPPRENWNFMGPIHAGVLKTKRGKLGKLFAAIGSYGLFGVATSVVAGTFHPLCQAAFKVAKSFSRNFSLGALQLGQKASVAKKTN